MKLSTLLVTLTTLLTTSLLASEPFRTTEKAFTVERGDFAIVFDIQPNGKIKTTPHVNRAAWVNVLQNQIALIGPVGPSRAVWQGEKHPDQYAAKFFAELPAVAKAKNQHDPMEETVSLEIEYQFDIDGKQLTANDLETLAKSLGDLRKLPVAERLAKLKEAAYRHFVPNLAKLDGLFAAEVAKIHKDNPVSNIVRVMKKPASGNVDELKVDLTDETAESSNEVFFIDKENGEVVAYMAELHEAAYSGLPTIFLIKACLAEDGQCVDGVRAFTVHTPWGESRKTIEQASSNGRLTTVVK